MKAWRKWFRTYLQKMGMPDALFTAMQKISSDNIILLSENEITAYGLEGDDPAYMEWQRAKEIASQGKEQYEVNINFRKVMGACLNYAGGDNPNYCTDTISPLFAKRLDACIASNGIPPRTECARAIADEMVNQLR